MLRIIMKKIRILHVLGTFDRGGIETLVMNIYRKINRDKYEFVFVTHDKRDHPYSMEIKSNGDEIYNVPKYKVYNHPKYVKAWKNVFSKSNIDIVHAHARTTAKIYLKIAKKSGLNTILHSHSKSSRGNLIARLIKKLFQMNITSNADCLISCSNDAAIWLFGKKVLKTREYVFLPNGFNTEKFIYNEDLRNQIRTKLLLDNEIVIGHVGSYTEAKNHWKIINVFNLLYMEEINIKLLLIGSGPLKNKITDRIKKMNLDDRVIVIESLPNPHDYLNAMDAFIFPSKFEGLGMALIEAEVNGLKCFISDQIPHEAIISKSVTPIKLIYSDLKWASVIKGELKNLTRSEILDDNYLLFDISNTINILMKIYDEISFK